MKKEDRNQTLLEMLFEGKNKAYGAFQLRQSYSKNLTKAFVFGSSFILFIFLSSFFFLKSQGHTVVEAPYYPVHELIPLNEEAYKEPPVKDEVPIQHQTEKVATVKLWEAIEPVADPVKEDSIASFEDIKEKVISSFNQEGIKSVIMITPPVLPTTGVKNAKITLPPIEKTENKVFDRVERQPIFEGGDSEMYKFLGKNLRYPAAASRSGTQGTVFVSFIIEKDGSISQAKVLKGIGLGCDEEALRVINKMPKWEAGQQNGQNVRVRFTIPIKFKIS